MFPVIIAAILYLILLGLCGRHTAKYAAQKGRSQTAWFIWGSLLFPLPHIVLALLPPRRKATEA
ncbi:hypothetical protein [Bradyrhizobium lablabi]|uniref:hypothetical protein n=1 Tax=Bradyrhizobium lablabi TaxID=722472 RepID=UPI001BA9EBB6|nr:hypothetical protein [Bradyrhizobium lablabi]MBR0696331.1 hypothetical protein [Bradyrhizobium lablabi]